MALVLAGCGQVGHAIDEALFNIGLTICGTFGMLGLWGLIATIRGPRVGVFTLVMSLLLGAIVVAFTVDGTSGLDPSPGTISRGAAILMWLPQTLAFAAVVSAARFAADRLPRARARVAWYAAAAILAIYVGLLVRATTRVIVPPLQGRVAAVVPRRWAGKRPPGCPGAPAWPLPGPWWGARRGPCAVSRAPGARAAWGCW